jgi:hypothetical protein
MNKIYKYEIKGLARNDQTWVTKGSIDCEFNDAFSLAMRNTFEQLTNGKAVYGKPGVGCQGPYDVFSVMIERMKQ